MFDVALHLKFFCQYAFIATQDCCITPESVVICPTFSVVSAGSFVWQMLRSPIFTAGKGEGWLDGGAPFYATYKTKDDKYVAVGALEAQFYSKLIEGWLFSIAVHFSIRDYIMVYVVSEYLWPPYGIG